MEHNQRYQLGSWVVCPRTNTLSNGIDTRAIDNKSMQVLLYLMQRSGEDLTKGEIVKHVWRDSFVADDILSVAISKIRKALGDNARSPTFIKTLPGVGYILIAEVSKIEDTKEAHAKSTQPMLSYIGVISLLLIIVLSLYFVVRDKSSPSASLNINSIAVLPFDDLSVQQDHQYFSDGLSDAIINQLSQIPSLKVISRYSSFTYRGQYNATDIGQELKVAALLDGSVQKVGEQIRINVRIFSTEDGQQLWSKTFDSDSQTLFELQDSISAAIQDIIQPDGGPRASLATKHEREPLKRINTQAYEWYLMGQYHWRQKNPKALNKAVTYFQHSLELEPDYAEAHIGLGITYSLLHHWANWSEEKAIEAALPHIMKALALKPDSARALAAKGMVLTDKAYYQEARFGELDSTMVQQAQQAFIRSLELDDNATTHHWYSKLLKRLGKKSEVIQHMNRAIELNPLSASLKRSLSFYFQSQGEQDSAQKMYLQALSLDSEYFSQVIDAVKMNRYTPELVLEITEWYLDNAELFETCSSDEYCEELAFIYLSIGANKMARELNTKLMPQHLHFRVFLDAIQASELGDDSRVVSSMERLYQYHPTNKLNLFRLATAQFRAGEFTLAEGSLLQLHPEWRDKTSIRLTKVTADNYSSLVLYAATLANLDEKEAADLVFNKMQRFLKQKRIFDSVQTEFTLAEVNAQLDNKPQALVHLNKALEMGWLESYNREWWSLQNNHLLRPLHGEPEFNTLLKQHQKKLNELRDRVTQRLRQSSTSVE
ncbi:winged helix-turn-helix domain-containing protein [Pleionea sp. CnH1-48]|uniref:winged helix-turn-helix domain-containing protein n=1 Tax=Pleionea sp. CnH1-48 TaxID=2954494 RepID=UPI00209781FD|nr:winged helix-turn-helix domain-containing protein [Pleionea sp. CnH1-48]MCO7224912.1 winged helix-turn-helix domain-containing protein [Pleionea sp. CnH1-48]